MPKRENAKITPIRVKIIKIKINLKKTKIMKQATNTIEQNTEIFNTYLKENSLGFQTEKIKNLHNELQGNSKQNLTSMIYLGQLFESSKAVFLSAESKQARKNLGLKITIKYFLEQNFSLSEGYINKLIKGYENREMLKEYLETGHVGKCISIDNFNKYCNPTKETSEGEVTEGEVTEGEVTEVSEGEGEQTAFGGITLTINKASKQDIEEAIKYLTNLVN